MSLYAIHLPNRKTANTEVLRLMGRLLSGSGVIEPTGFTVSAQATPDMTIKVSGSTVSDNLVIITATGDTYHAWNTANANVTITSNSTGVTRKDHIVAYIDTAYTSDTPSPGGLVLIAVRGTGTAAPTDAEINAITSSKPWLRLAEITIANGAGSINSGNIVDLRAVIGMKAGLIKQSAAPFAMAGYTNNMKMDIVAVSPPTWNGLTGGSGATETITFPNLTIATYAFAVVQKGSGGSGSNYCFITLESQVPSPNNQCTFHITNLSAGTIYISSVMYVAFGT